MELNKTHRECLIDELKLAKENLDLKSECFNKCKDKEISSRFEIHIFLAKKINELIEKSLIDNEIDF